MAKKTEVIKVSTELQGNLDIITAFKAQVDSIAQNCLQIKVVDDSTANIAQQNLTKASQILKSIDEKRKEIKEPYLEAGKLIDSTCKTIVQELEVAVLNVKGEIKRYVDELEEKKRIEKERIEKEAAAKLAEQQKDADRKQRILNYINDKVPTYLQAQIATLDSADKCDVLIDYIKTKLQPDDKMQEFAPQYIEMKSNYAAMIEAKKQSFIAAENISEEQKELLKKKQELAERKLALAAEEREIAAAEEAAKQEAGRKRLAALAEAEKTAVDAEKVAKTKKIWKFEVMDMSKVNPDWLMVDESKVKAYLADHKDSIKHDSVIFGIRFFQETNVSA